MNARAVETEAAPAKVNLALHVTGRRPDGYHLLDSLVVFAGDVADRVTVAEAPELSLRVTGPFAASVPSGGDNLVLRAARAFAAPRGAAITLEKNLPVASGIGGGSADAAAVLRALSRLWRLPLPPSGVILALGADVPVCLAGRPARMRGVGEELEPLHGPAPVHLLLVNPGIPVPTAQVFAGLAQPHNPPLPDIPAFQDAVGMARFVALCRNDLQPAAKALVPQIAEVLAAIAGTEGCLLARMSGSGATCFGLYPDTHLRDAARAVLARRHPAWWVAG